MRVAILAHNANSFVKPTAEGLQRMLAQIGLRSTVFYHGLSSITARSKMSADRALDTRVKGIVRYVLQEYRFYNLLRQLRRYDVIVVVNHLPNPFKRDSLRDAEIRKLLPQIPIVLYDLAYLPTRGPWAKWLLEGNPKVGVAGEMNRGLERYDWYLVASVVSEFSMPQNYQMYSLIGLNIDDGSLIPQENEEFTALIDFERIAHMKERSVQISALEETHTKYIVLQGEYPLEEIRKLYRRCHIYFVAHRESFGLPICELQACGAYIFTPYAEWCPSHWLKKDLSIPGPGELSPNFIVYGNNKDKLIERINYIKRTHDKKQVFDSFVKYHPQLFYGDLDELKKFIGKIQRGEIHSKSHRQHPTLSSLVEAIGPC